MTYNIGTANGVITMTYNGRGVQEANRDVQGLEKNSASASERLSKMGNVATVSGGLISSAMGLAINSAANFEQRLSAIQAVSGATSKQMDLISQKALQLGKDTQFSASESANAIEELIKAGLSVSDVINGAADATVNLAAAGEVDMPTAATIAANAMNQFGLTAKEMVGVVDNIAGASNASAIDVNDFGQSLQQVGAVAHLAGVNFQDTATAIALMGNAGIKGSDAGTSLKTMLMNLIPQTKKQSTLMEHLGLLTKDGSNQFFDATGHLKSLAQVSQILQNSLKGQTAEQKQLNLQTLFGSDAIRAAAVLTNQGAKGFDKMSKAMGKVTAADVAAKRMDNLKGSIEQLKGSIETVMIVAGTPLLGTLKKIVDMVTQVVNVFLNLPAPLQQAIVTFVSLVGTLLTLTGIFLKVRAAIQAGSVALTLFTGPVGLIIAAIAALVAAFIYFYKTNAQFRKFVQAAGVAVREYLAKAMAFLVPLIQAAIPHLIAAAKVVRDVLVEAFKRAWPVIKAFGDIIVKDVMPAVKSFAEGALKGLVNAWNQVRPSIMPLISAVKDFVKTIASVAVPVIKAYVTVLIWWYKFLLSKVVPVVLRLGGVFAQVFGTVIGKVLSGFIGILTGAFKLAAGIIKFWVALFTGDWAGAWHAMGQILSAAWTIIKGILKVAFAAFTTLMSIGWNLMKNLTAKAWHAIKSKVSAGLNNVKNAVKNGLANAVGFVVNGWNAAKTKTTEAWNNMKNAVKTKIGDIVTKVKGIPDKMRTALAGLGSVFYNKGREMIQRMIDGIGSMFGALKDKASGLFNSTIGKLLPGSPVKEGPLLKLNRGHAGKEIVKMLITGIDSMAPALRTAMDGAVTPLAGGGYATPGPGSLATPRGRGRAGRTGRARLLDGELRLDPSGRAFIRGVASSEDDDHDDYADTLGRMNR